ncbi:MAG: hypothetical protein R3228_19405 [Halioglobus sp.]|nr:hypothetical protein [Halioglobus sp.]
MAVVSDTIPEPLQPQVDAALAWFNAGQAQQFEVTGIVDAEKSIASGEPRQISLVLCGGDLCQRQNFLVSSTGAGFDVSLARETTAPAQGAGTVQSELDPPPGALRNWLDSVRQRHSFTLLLFYRGFW